MIGPARLIARLLGVALFAAVVLWLAWKPVRGLYFDRRAGLRQRIEALTADVERYSAAAGEHPDIRRAIDGYADRTLGPDLQTVDHQLRSRLNRIGEQLALEGLSVGTGRSRRLETPARSQFSRREPELRDEIDFVEVEAWISGQGDLDRALRLLRQVRAEPWIKRIQEVRLQPRDNGERFAVTVRLVTIFLPGRSPGGTLAAAAPVELAEYEPLAARNPFRLPPPPAPAAAVVAQATAAPAPAPAYNRWTLTGVAATLAGEAEIWLLDRASGESMRLAVGEALGDLELVAADGDAAEFRLGDDRFTVTVGGTLEK